MENIISNHESERMQKVLDRIDGNENETLPSLIDKVYEKIITTKDTQCYINLNGKKYKLIEFKMTNHTTSIQITLENNMIIVFDETNIDFFITNAIIAVYQPFFV